MATFYDENGKPVTADQLNAAPAGPAPSAGNDEPGWFEPGSKSEAAARGAINGATLGLGKYAAAPVNALMDDTKGKSYWDKMKDFVKDERAADVSAVQANPGSYLAGGIVPALATGLASGAAKAGTSAIAPLIEGGGTTGTIARNAVAGATQGAAQSGGDTTDTLAGAVIGGAIPAAGAALKAGKDAILNVGKSGAAQKAASFVEDLAAQKGNPGTGDATQSAWEALQPRSGMSWSTNPATSLADSVRTKGIDAMNSIGGPAWNAVKAAIQQKSPGVIDAVKDNARNYSIGAGAGAGLGSMVGHVGSVIGGLVGGAPAVVKGVKDAVANKAMVAATSPAAQAGQKKLISTITDKAGSGPQDAGRFAAITTFLNQTDPDVRAATNSENPLNKEDQQ